MDLGSTIGEAAWSECEAVIRRFEDAWREPSRPDIVDFLNINTPYRTRLLVELVHVDLDVRLRAAEYVWVEDYLTRFPALQSSDLLVDLLAAEFTLRARHRPPVWPEEYWLRFPELTAVLRERLPSADRPGWFTDTRPVVRAGRPIPGPPNLPGYEIQGELGRGGMGVVYRAHDLTLNRIVAIKTFATVPRPEELVRFAREAEAIAGLDHPHIVPVYKVGEWTLTGGPAVPFFVMKWYQGGSLDVAPAGPGTPPAAHARAVEQIALAVHHAHQRGILHRDLKPSNILLDDTGRPHVADFGLAGRVDTVAALTAVVAGTPAYMAPEQLKDPRSVSTATDVYGLGAILYHQLTGTAPYSSDSPFALISQVETAPPPVPSQLNPAVARDLDVITRKCLDKDPQRRYASAAALADDLERWRSGLPIAARPTPAWERAWRGIRRYPLRTALAASTLAALVTAVVVLADGNARIRVKEKETSDALARETRLLREIESSLEREQTALYLERVTSAGRLYQSNQLAQAWALLDQCPEHLRGWEWRYLDSLRDDQSVKLPGHTGFVVGTGFLPDGRAVTVDIRGALRVWDAAKGSLLVTHTVDVNAVAAVDYHPTRNWVAVAGHTGIAVVDIDTGKSFKPTGSRWVAFHPDGKQAATANAHVIHLWSLPEWTLAGKLHGHADPDIVLFGAFDPNGKRLITSGSDKTVRTWDLETRMQTNSRPTAAAVPKLLYSPDGRTLAECHLGSVVLFDATTGELQDRVDHPTDDRTVAAFPPQTNSLAVGGTSGEVIIWDRGRHRQSQVYRGHVGRITSLAFGPNRRLVSGGWDSAARIWDTSRNQECRTLAAVGTGAGRFVLAPDGSWLAAGPRVLDASTETWAMIVDATSGRDLRRLPCRGGVDVQRSTGRLAVGRDGGGITLYDPLTGNEIWSRPYPPDITAKMSSSYAGRTAFSPSGDRLATWVYLTRELLLWNPSDGTVIDRVPFEGALVYDFNFSSDGSKLAVATKDHISIVDLKTKSRMKCPESDGVFQVQFSPNGAWMASVEADRSVKLREAATGRVLQPFVGSATGVVTLAFSPNSKRLATGGIDKLVRIWDVDSGRELLTLKGGDGIVQHVTWDKAGSRLFVLNDALRVWSTGD